MNTGPLLIKLFAALALTTTTMTAPSQRPAHQDATPETQKNGAFVLRPHLVGQRGANEAIPLPGDGNLPEAASALPLLSAIGAGALLGGLLSARRAKR